MTIILESGTKRPMGRPPLKAKIATVAVLIRLPEDLKDRIDAVAGENRRGEFMREAVIRELARRERAVKDDPPSQTARARSKDAE